MRIAYHHQTSSLHNPLALIHCDNSDNSHRHQTSGLHAHPNRGQANMNQHCDNSHSWPSTCSEALNYPCCQVEELARDMKNY
jgi:hypothetical protein